jgi:hypothetical protein
LRMHALYQPAATLRRCLGSATLTA